jgi:hypothetical protein
VEWHWYGTTRVLVLVPRDAPKFARGLALGMSVFLPVFCAAPWPKHVADF